MLKRLKFHQIFCDVEFIMSYVPYNGGVSVQILLEYHTVWLGYAKSFLGLECKNKSQMISVDFVRGRQKHGFCLTLINTYAYVLPFVCLFFK